HHQPAPRLPPLVVGYVPGHDLRLGHLRRDHRPLLDPPLPLHPLRADDLDRRDARFDPRLPGGGHGVTGMSLELEQRPVLYGLMAEFDTPDDLIRAVERVRADGYRQVEAYTPYPIEEVSHA